MGVDSVIAVSLRQMRQYLIFSPTVTTGRVGNQLQQKAFTYTHTDPHIHTQA